MNAPFTSTNTEPEATATFTGTADEQPVYAYYPYSEGVTDVKAIPAEIPAEQTYTDEGSVAAYDIKATDAVTADAAGGWRMSMRQMTALVRFEFDLTGVSALSADERLQDVWIQSDGAPLAGVFTYDLTNLDAGLTAGDYGMDCITLHFANPPAVSEKIIAYAAVAPGAQLGKTWQCMFTTSAHQVSFSTEALSDLEAGKYYVVPLNVTVLENNNAQYEEIAADESEEETANCYIVTEAGEHSFKATVIGNGEKGIIPGAGFHTDSPYINPQSAKVLWSDSQNWITDVRLEGGRVYYTVNADDLLGNAVIAVYSEPDCQGEILWSWHIWGTEGMPEDEVYTNQAGATFSVMDRDLGALRVGDSRVMLYQWGRKDPFMAYNSGAYYYEDGVTRKSAMAAWPTLANAAATIADGVRNPMQIINSGNYDNLNWLAEPNYYLWGDAGRGLPADLTDPLCGAGWGQQKTIYDPSPVGYRVANIFTFSGFTKMPGGSTGDVADTDDGIPVCLERLDYINFIKANNSDDWLFMKDAGDTEGSCYPGIGARDGDTGSAKSTGYKVGGRWWGAEAYTGDGGKPEACCMITDEWRNSAPISPNNGNEIMTYERTVLLHDTYGIRCVRDE